MSLQLSSSESIWKLANGTDTELWSGQGARVSGAPAISPDGRNIAFSVRQSGKTLLYVVQSDGTNAWIVTDSLDLQGSPAWAMANRSPRRPTITASRTSSACPSMVGLPSHSLAVLDRPAWAPDGRFLVYSGPDIGTTFSVKAVSAEASASLPTLTLTRGADTSSFCLEDVTSSSFEEISNIRISAGSTSKPVPNAVDQPLSRL